MIQTAVTAAANAFGWLTTSARGLLGYDAGEASTRRKMPAPDRRTEDLILNPSQRAAAIENNRDLNRNFCLVGWAIRKHLDFVTRHRFQGANKDKGLNRAIEQFMEEWSQNCDISGRHNLMRMVRILEARAVMDGDCGLALVKGGWLQGVEGDRIKDIVGLGLGLGLDSARGGGWIHGVRIDAYGTPVEYAVHKRGIGRMEFERYVRAEFLKLHGYFDRFDQVRGISPLLSAINTFRDVHEELQFAHAASKVRQLFVLLLTRNAADAAGAVAANSTDNPEGDATGYSVDFGRGPQLLDLDPGDDAKFLESAHPASQFQAFIEQALGMCLKALDLPYSFYDESWTNFYGSRGAVMQYETSCHEKRANIRLGILDPVTRWRLGWAVIDDELQLPSGMEATELKWNWIPNGTAFWDQSKEVPGSVAAIRAGYDNPQRVCRQVYGTDFYENIDLTAEAIAYATGKGVALDFAPDPTLAAQANADAEQAKADAAAAQQETKDAPDAE